MNTQIENNTEEHDWLYTFMHKQYPSWIYFIVMAGFGILLYILLFTEPG